MQKQQLKLAYFLRNLQTSLANNSRILRIKNSKFSGYCSYEHNHLGRFSNLHQCTFKVWEFFFAYLLLFKVISQTKFNQLATQNTVELLLFKKADFPERLPFKDAYFRKAAFIFRWGYFFRICCFLEQLIFDC